MPNNFQMEGEINNRMLGALLTGPIDSVINLLLAVNPLTT